MPQSVALKGLPFTVLNVTNAYSGLTIGYHTGLTTAVVWIGGIATPNTTAADIYLKTAAATAVTSCASADLANTTDLIFSCTYRANA